MSYHILHKSSHSYVEENRTVVRRPPNKRPLIKSAFQCCEDLVAAAEQDMFNETSGHFQPGSWQQSRMFSPRRQDISCLDCGKKTEYSWQGVWTFPVWLGAEMSRGYFRLFTLHLKLIFSDEASGRFQLRCRKNISQNNHVLKPDVGTSTSGFLIWRQH